MGGAVHIIRTETAWQRHLAVKREDLRREALVELEQPAAPEELVSSDPEPCSSPSSSSNGSLNQPLGVQPSLRDLGLPVHYDYHDSDDIEQGPDDLPPLDPSPASSARDDSEPDEISLPGSPNSLPASSANSEDDSPPASPYPALPSSEESEVQNRQSTPAPESRDINDDPNDFIIPQMILDHRQEQETPTMQFESENEMDSEPPSPIPQDQSDSESERDINGNAIAHRVGQMHRGFVRTNHSLNSDSIASYDSFLSDESIPSDISSTADDDSEDEVDDSEDDVELTVGNGEQMAQSGFDYRNPLGEQLTKQEMLSFALHDISLKHKIAREASRDSSDLVAAVVPRSERPFDYRTARKRIEQRTGVKDIQYDCCSESHMSYASYPDMDNCMYCQRPRWMASGLREGKKIPYATHSYIPVTHRLALMFSNPSTAESLVSYRYSAEQDRGRGVRSDFWSSDLFDTLKQKGLFQQDTDVAFMMSTDGVRVFKSRKAFNIWPILLVPRITLFFLLP